MFNKALVTVWSAPNYCYRCNNVASILRLDENLEQKFIIFEAASHVLLLITPVITHHPREKGSPRVLPVINNQTMESTEN
jgi:hypothetical protein